MRNYYPNRKDWVPDHLINKYNGKLYYRHICRCSYCLDSKMHKNRKREYTIKEKLREYDKENM